MNEVFELRCQDHVHENHGQAEGDEKILSGFLQSFGAAAEDHGITWRKVERADVPANIFHRFTECLVHEVRDNAYLALALEAIDLIRPARFVEAHDVRELDETGVIRATEPHGHILERLLSVAIAWIGPKPHVIKVVVLAV